MTDKFEQISIKPGFMKHNGGVLFRSISDTEYEFKTIINENHLNAAGITHGGYLSAINRCWSRNSSTSSCRIMHHV